MHKSHAPYPAEFRQQMIELVVPAVTRGAIAGIRCTAQSIRNWVAQAAIDRGKPCRQGRAADC